MQENNNGGMCQVCGAGVNGRCGACGMSNRYFGHHVLRWVLGILIISWVFSIGMKIGELQAMVEMNSPYGYGSHMFYRAAPAAMGWSTGSMIAPEEGNVTFTTSSAPAMMTGVKGGTIQVIKGN